MSALRFEKNQAKSIDPFILYIKICKKARITTAYFYFFSGAKIKAMYIKKLFLQNYRNYLSETFEFSPGINIIYGANAQGKTNVAEAIFYLCTGYSPRVTREKQVINHNAETALISAEAQSPVLGGLNASIEFSQNGKKITVNGSTAAKTAELIGNINAVMFNPQQLKLVQESPEDRRRFLDVALSQISRKYLNALGLYKKILVQRNNLLKNSDRELIFETLPVWDEQLASAALVIILERNAFITKLKPYCEEVHSTITSGKEKLEISYDFKFSGEPEEIKTQLKQSLFECMEKDVELGYTTVGPHRDDIKIKINGLDARIYGSQGQQRTGALSLIIGELKIFKDHFGEYPALILDDAMSELDGIRRKSLLSMLDGVQALITCTDAEIMNFENAKFFHIENGKIIKE